MSGERPPPAAPDMVQALVLAAPAAGASASADVEFSDIFSTRRPKDLAAGVSSGLKSITKGIAGGLGGLVAAPVIGARQDGARGFFAGLGAGLASAVCLPVLGIGVAAVQVGRGAVNTPEAVAETFKRNKRWDAENRQWVADDLKQDVKNLSAFPKDDDDVFQALKERKRAADGVSTWASDLGGGAGAGEDGSAAAGSANVKESTLYDALGVAPSATESELKKAYYKLARELHPDKNPDDPEAHARFQRIGEAYQILSNPETREKYDKHGKEGVDAVDADSLMDPTLFFGMLFGSDKFDHLVGRLQLATIFASGGDVDRQALKEIQRRREIRIAANLAGLLERHVAGDVEGFKATMRAEAEELRKASFGATMLRTIGVVYELQGRRREGNIIEDGITAVRERGHAIAQQARAARSALAVFGAYRKVQKDLKHLDDDAKGEPKDANAAAATSGAGAGATGEASTAAGPADASGNENGGDASAAAGEGAAGTSTDPPASSARDADANSADDDGDSDDDADGGGATAQLEAKLQREALPAILEALIRVNVLDLESTVRHACGRVLYDGGVSLDVRKARARALVCLGDIFKSVEDEEVAAGADGTTARADRAQQAVEQAMQGMVEAQLAKRDREERESDGTA